jgi:hypothetical protein
MTALQRSCDECGATEGEVRPVMLVGKELPRLLCSECHDRLDDQDEIDWTADRERFGYGVSET